MQFKQDVVSCLQKEELEHLVPVCLHHETANTVAGVIYITHVALERGGPVLRGMLNFGREVSY